MNGRVIAYVYFPLRIADMFYRYEACIYNWDRTDHNIGYNFTSNETEAVTSLQTSCGLLANRRDRMEENGKNAVLSLILPRFRTGTVWFYTSTSNRRAARPKLYTKSLTRDLKLMYSRLTLVRISINL